MNRQTQIVKDITGHTEGAGVYSTDHMKPTEALQQWVTWGFQWGERGVWEELSGCCKSPCCETGLGEAVEREEDLTLMHMALWEVLQGHFNDLWGQWGKVYEIMAVLEFLGPKVTIKHHSSPWPLYRQTSVWTKTEF
ncbi:hypothetical protein CB1_001596007 [Camelus ferus]|nr:hypothetical protein CB1_001596007 [Camelus ferus]